MVHNKERQRPQEAIHQSRRRFFWMPRRHQEANSLFHILERQINISLEDPRLSEIFVNVPTAETLSISFESSVFRDGWAGVIEFRFKTEKAHEFHDVLKSLGAQQGAAPDGNSADPEC